MISRMLWIVQRELILQSPGENTDCQPNKDKAESTKTRTECVRALHKTWYCKFNITESRTPAKAWIHILARWLPCRSGLRQLLRKTAVCQVFARCDVFIEDGLKLALHLRMLVGDTLQLFGIILQVIQLRLVVSLVLVLVPHY